MSVAVRLPTLCDVGAVGGRGSRWCVAVTQLVDGALVRGMVLKEERLGMARLGIVGYAWSRTETPPPPDATKDTNCSSAVALAVVASAILRLIQ